MIILCCQMKRCLSQLDLTRRLRMFRISSTLFRTFWWSQLQTWHAVCTLTLSNALTSAFSCRSVVETCNWPLSAARWSGVCFVWFIHGNKNVKNLPTLFSRTYQSHGINNSSIGYKLSDHVVVSFPGCDVKRCQSILVPDIDKGIVFQEQLDDSFVSKFGGEMKWGSPTFVEYIHSSILCHEDFDYFRMSMVTCVQKRWPSILRHNMITKCGHGYTTHLGLFVAGRLRVLRWHLGNDLLQNIDVSRLRTVMNWCFPRLQSWQ